LSYLLGLGISDLYHTENRQHDLIFSSNPARIVITTTKGSKMAKSALYKVGDTYTSQKSKVTGTIVEISPNSSGSVRVKLDVEGKTRWTTWRA
jgi:hypothetical protein